MNMISIIPDNLQIFNLEGKIFIFCFKNYFKSHPCLFDSIEEKHFSFKIKIILFF